MYLFCVTVEAVLQTFFVTFFTKPFNCVGSFHNGLINFISFANLVLLKTWTKDLFRNLGFVNGD